MYRMRMSEKAKNLIEETAEMCGLSVSSIFRTVGKWIENGRVSVCPSEKGVCRVRRKDGNVVKIKISENYHRNLTLFMSVENFTMPGEINSAKDFRKCIIAACIDTVNRYRAEHERLAALDRQMQTEMVYTIQEKQALIMGA